MGPQKASDRSDVVGQDRDAFAFFHDIGERRRHLKLGPRLSRAWQEMEQITIGAIEGFCIGGGVALAVALDFRVMARDAHMRVPEIGLGMNMSWQSVPRMLHLMGPARTKQAVILADHRITAAEAYEWGYSWDAETRALCEPSLRAELAGRGIALAAPSMAAS